MGQKSHLLILFIETIGFRNYFGLKIAAENRTLYISAAVFRGLGFPIIIAPMNIQHIPNIQPKNPRSLMA